MDSCDQAGRGASVSQSFDLKSINGSKHTLRRTKFAAR
jgi:hypothetical protein